MREMKVIILSLFLMSCAGMNRTVIINKEIVKNPNYSNEISTGIIIYTLPKILNSTFTIDNEFITKTNKIKEQIMKPEISNTSKMFISYSTDSKEMNKEIENEIKHNDKTVFIVYLIIFIFVLYLIKKYLA
jgi:cytochrome c biogenesis protein ResB